MDVPIDETLQYKTYGSFASTAKPLTSYAREEVLQVLDLGTESDSKGWQMLSSVEELKVRRPCDLRIISAPLDIPSRENGYMHLQIFKHYEFPAGFLTERLRSVGHSFGNCTREDVEYTWFHFLCKNITFNANGQLKIINPNRISDADQLSQADHTWHRSGFMLCSRVNAASGMKEVTLICFGAHFWIQRQFNEYLDWANVTKDPMILFHMIFEELYLQLDEATRRLGEVFGNMETNVLSHATLGGIAGRMDFAGLHNISKHITHLLEGAEAALLTINLLLEHISRCPQTSPSPSSSPSISTSTSTSTLVTTPSQTHSSLSHISTLINSTKLRLHSLSSRSSNIINLSFHLVTQQDSKSMKTIAFLTLIFLPASTVASIFGSQFFNLSVTQDGTKMFVFSHWFWVMWVIVLPVTVGLVVVWRWPEAMASDAKQEKRFDWKCLLCLLNLRQAGEIGPKFVAKEEI